MRKEAPASEWQERDCPLKKEHCQANGIYVVDGQRYKKSRQCALWEITREDARGEIGRCTL